MGNKISRPHFPYQLELKELSVKAEEKNKFTWKLYFPPPRIIVKGDVGELPQNVDLDSHSMLASYKVPKEGSKL